MKSLKKFFALCLTLALVLSLAACVIQKSPLFVIPTLL